MITVATALWWPSLNPVGPPSVFAVLVGLVLWTGASKLFGPRPSIRRILVAGAPLILLALCALTEGSVVFYEWHHGRSFPNADDYTAGIIYLAFGFGFALRNFRVSSLLHPLNGGVCAIVYGYYIFDTIRWFRWMAGGT